MLLDSVAAVAAADARSGAYERPLASDWRPWADRARSGAELAGEAAARQRPQDQDILTPQELRVAQLAPEGLTNREIGAQLFISPRTVGHHLSNVFAKLGLATRTELRDIDLAGDLRLTA